VLLQSARFAFQRVSDARALSAMAALDFPDPQKKVVGISELAYNAIEHVNL